MGDNQDTWPGGQTWVFQGTVAEDATGGTHVCTLTVTPGAGNEIQILQAQVQDGNTATAQVVQVFTTDGTNVLDNWTIGVSDTAQTLRFLPTNDTIVANTPTKHNSPMIETVSGTMQFIIKVTTTAISVTQTFAVVCRLKTGQIPTAVLADSVGTPTLTINTNKVF